MLALTDPEIVHLDLDNPESRLVFYRKFVGKFTKVVVEYPEGAESATGARAGGPSFMTRT
jgi:hypothetical protein